MVISLPSLSVGVWCNSVLLSYYIALPGLEESRYQVQLDHKLVTS